MEPGAPPVPYTAADGWRPLQIWGMGIASQDVTGDGVPEVFLTSQGDNKLQTLVHRAGAPTYKDIALPRGVTASRPFAGGDVLPSTAWHAEFQDVNNDGFVDLFVTKGNVDAQPDYANRDPSNLLLGTADGTFVESAERGRDPRLPARTWSGTRRLQPRRHARPRRRAPRRQRHVVAQHRAGRRRQSVEAMGKLDRGAGPPTGTERRRDRSLDRRADRRSRRDPRAHDRRRARRRTARLGPLRARPERAGARSGSSGRTARSARGRRSRPARARSSTANVRSDTPPSRVRRRERSRRRRGSGVDGG